jgi:hypothetical protein
VKGVLLVSSVEVSGCVFPLIVFLGIGWGRVARNITHEEKESLMHQNLISDPVNLFPNPLSIPKLPFTV